MATITVELPTFVSRLHRHLAAAGAFDGDWDVLDVVVGSEWAHPGVLAFLDSWGRLMRSQGRTLNFTGPAAQMRYLSRMGLLDHVGFEHEKDYVPVNETGRFMPLQLLDDAGSVKRATNALCDLIVKRFENARDFLPSLEWAVYEVVDNVRVHAQSEVSGTVCAQYTKN